jgi:hypothetical protein
MSGFDFEIVAAFLSQNFYQFVHFVDKNYDEDDAEPVCESIISELENLGKQE